MYIVQSIELFYGNLTGIKAFQNLLDTIQGKGILTMPTALQGISINTVSISEPPIRSCSFYMLVNGDVKLAKNLKYVGWLQRILAGVALNNVSYGDTQLETCVTLCHDMCKAIYWDES